MSRRTEMVYRAEPLGTSAHKFPVVWVQQDNAPGLGDTVNAVLRDSRQAKYGVAKLTRKYNNGKVLGIFIHKRGRAIYVLLKNKEPSKIKRFFATA